MRSTTALVLAGFGFLSAPAFASGDAPVDAVTVYPDRALVERSVPASADAAGGFEVRIGGLSTSLIERSLRASAPEGLSIRSVEFRRVPRRDALRPRIRELESEIDGLEEAAAAARDAKAAAEFRLDLLKTNGAELTKAVDSWRSGLDDVGDRAADALAARSAAERRIAALGEQIRTLRREIAGLNGARNDETEVVVALEAERSGAWTLDLAYQVSGARWSPLYDARLDVQAGRIALERFAEVSQNSGEDWAGVELELSTARPAAGGVMPRPGTWWVDVRPDGPGTMGRMDRAFSAMPEAATADMAMGSGTAKTTATTQAHQTLYRVAGRVDVPSDGAGHVFGVGEDVLEADVSARVHPARSETAYLVASARYRGDETLLPGPVDLFRDGTYVGAGRLGATVGGDEVEFGFGIDPRIAVERRVLERRREETGTIRAHEMHTRKYATRIRNGHDVPVRVVVLEQVPQPRSDQIEVDVLSDTTRPSRRDHDGARGVFAWDWKAAPGSERVIRFGFALEHPADVQVPGF